MSKKLKRLLAGVVGLCVGASSMLSGLAFAAVDEKTAKTENADMAYIKVGKYIKTQNVSSYRFGEADTTVVVEKEGKTGVQFKKGSGDSTLFWYINLDDSVFYTPEGSSAYVTVEYFDEGTQKFSLRFDSNEDEWDDNNDVVKLENTKTWKTHTFEINNARFTNRCNGCDIVVALWTKKMEFGGNDVIFGDVTVEKKESHLKASFESDVLGNIFGDKDNFELRLNVESTDEGDYEADFEYSVFDHYDNLLYTESTKTQTQDGKSVVCINPKVSKYGTYSLKGSLSYTVGEKSFSYPVEASFSRSYKFEKGEKLNDNFGVCSHWGRYDTEELMEMHNSLVAAMGAGWDRSEIQWALAEKEKGKFVWPDYGNIIQKQYEDYGIKTLMILDYGNPIYEEFGGIENVIPDSPEAIELFRKYCEETVKKYGAWVDAWEIWNEPNGVGFNKRQVGPEVYGNLVKEIAPTVKALDPTATVIGGVSCDEEPDWYRKVYDAGAYDVVDAVSQHPYEFRGKGMVGWREVVNDVYDVGAEYGEKKDLWISEKGSSRKEGGDNDIYKDMVPGNNIKWYSISMSEGKTTKFFKYEMIDSGTNQTNPEHTLGTVKNLTGVDTPLAAHPEFVAYAFMNKTIGNAEVGGFVRSDNEEKDAGIDWYKTTSGKDALIAWSYKYGTSYEFTVDLGCGSIDKYDIYGNKLGTLTSKDGKFVLYGEGVPVYYIGNITKFEKVENGADISISQNALTLGAGENYVFEASDKQNRTLTVEAERAEGLEVVENNNGKLVIKTPADKKSDKYGYEITISVFADGELVMHTTKNIKTVILEDSIKIERASDNYAKACLTIKNNSVYTPLSGTAKISIDGYDDFMANPVRFSEIPAGESRTYEITLPRMVKKRQFKINTSIKTDLGFEEETVSALLDLTEAKYAQTKPKIDGKISPGEYKGAWFASDDSLGASKLSAWRGAEDASFLGILMWDEDYLYMAVKSTDDIFFHPNGETAWKVDGLQFAFNDPKSENASTEKFTSMSFYAPSAGAKLWIDGGGEYDNKGHFADSENFAVTRAGTQTVYEAKIPWSDIFYEGYVPSESDPIGFSIMQNDNDGGGRRGWMEYGGGIGDGRDSRKFVTLNFVK